MTSPEVSAPAGHQADEARRQMAERRETSPRPSLVVLHLHGRRRRHERLVAAWLACLLTLGMAFEITYFHECVLPRSVCRSH